jgi:hypothetical protein
MFSNWYLRSVARFSHDPESLNYAIIHHNLRPDIDPDWDQPFKKALEDCWNKNPLIRPSAELLETIFTRLSLKPEFPEEIKVKIGWRGEIERPQACALLTGTNLTLLS